MPNGICVIASVADTIKVTKDLVLNDVLYLPEFNFNLVSISKVVRCNQCSVTFSYGHLSLKRTGSGKLKHGLYHLDYGGGNIVSVISNIFVNNDVFTTLKSAIWHFRFGHAFHAKLEICFVLIRVWFVIFVTLLDKEIALRFK